MTYSCIRFIDSYSFLSRSLDKLIKTLVDISHKTLKNLEEEIVDNDEIMGFVNKKIEDERTIEDLKKDYPNEIQKFRRSFT